MKRAAALLRRRQRDDDGLALVMVALLMVVLLLFAAFSVDAGNVYSTRRQAQSAADTAALAGALRIAGGDSLANAVSEVRDLSARNFDVTSAEWANDSTLCPNEPPAGYVSSKSLGIAGGSNCISFSAGFDRVRVRIPRRDVKLTFAKAAGFKTKPIGANAEAEIVAANGGGTSPWGLFAGFGGGTEACIQTGPSNADSCGSPTPGEFGAFAPYFYSDVNPANNPDTTCVSGAANADALALVVADGLDHLLGTYGNYNAAVDGDPGTPLNGPPCTAPFPRVVVPNTGYSSATQIEEGLLFGKDASGAFDKFGFSGRLVKNPATCGATQDIYGYSTIDNCPLWAYLTGGGPAECAAASILPLTFSTSAEAQTYKTAMKLCLTKWKPSDGPIFTNDLGKTKRLTVVPRYDEPAAVGPSGHYHINELVPMFYQALYADKTGSMSCDDENPVGTCIWEPGLSSTWAASGAQHLHSASGLVLDVGMLPEPLKSNLGGGAFPYTTRLVK
jgi:hypothetical protein